MSNLGTYFKELGNKLTGRRELQSPQVTKDHYLKGIAKGYDVPGTITAQLIATSIIGNPDKFKLKVVQTAKPFATEFENASGWTQTQAVKKTDGTHFTRAEAEKFIASFDGQDATERGFEATRGATKAARRAAWTTSSTQTLTA